MSKRASSLCEMRLASQYRLMSMAVAGAVEDKEDDMVYFCLKKRRTHDLWMSAWLFARTDPTQRNTLLKLEEDFIRLGCIKDFKDTTRMTPDVYFNLLELVRPYITYKKTNYREPITAEERLSLTIRYLTRGDSVLTLSQGYRVGKSTVLPLIQDTCRAIYRVLHPDYLKSPSNEEEWLEVSKMFHDRWNFPHTLGAVDGKHVRIKKPAKSGSLYYNYKNFFSIILFGLVDAEYKFLYVDVGAEGRASDSTLWRFSKFHKDMNKAGNPLHLPQPAPFPGFAQDLPYFFIGDDAFQMTTQLMKPYPSTTLTMEKRIYNYRLSRARRVVENAFGILATRFRIYRREIDMSPDNASAVVLATVVLHNYLRTVAPSAYLPREATDWEAKDYTQHRGLWRNEPVLPGGQPTHQRNTSEIVKDQRNSLARWCLQKEGSLKYQYDVVLEHDFFFDR